ncbi:MAG: type II toxin-antitoxin system ParD family antitoxin [Xanthobacteraceae bacterium]
MPKTASEERREKREALRQALVDGEQSGPSEGFDVQEFLVEMKRQRAA